MGYWLIKSEPSDYSLAELQADKVAIWDGVRNYQARNFLREMRVGDRLFYYHSNTKPPGIVGLAKVTQASIVDPTQFDEGHKYYDAKSTPEKPRWQTVEIAYDGTLTEMITLTQLKEAFSPDEFAVVRRGNRLSVMPVADDIAQRLLAMGSVQT
ncbi:EVE domain-containing protein [[Limnothrix rosea] IAM M-220]|uniref:EVE domain-containing protein n=1 Tax=[Limnothrix rosea] IAM M-220 TaxID=454133 RepID=UPI00095FD7FD|nr:EVE domain-containing protein [[Limnothrix rosea] IAM M-220]OKH19585.1 EVE domain-containing protein [[Limnothrix rosea] IAM M-220]